jgi:membrane-bound serine protease (ClpP class)
MRSQLRRIVIRVAVVCISFGIVLALVGPEAAVAAPRGTIDVIQVDGLIDPPNAALIRDAIKAANADKSELLVIKINSGGAVDVKPEPLYAAMRGSRVPIVAWVGPSGSKARGLAALLALDANVVAVSNGSSIGAIDPVLLDDAGVKPPTGAESSTVRNHDRSPILHRSLNSDQAVRRGVTDRVCSDPPGCATLGDFLISLDGKTVLTAAGPVKLETAKTVGAGKDRRRQPNSAIRFRKLDLTGQAVHTLTSPTIAYGLLVVGLALIIFEFFTISIGLAGGTGAIALVGAFVGFSHLPVTIWALVLIFLAMFGYAIDVQAGRAYSWTVISTILLIVASLFLYGGSSNLDVYWWAIILMVVAVVAFFVTAMPVAVRSRFSTPTIGRESLVGEAGEAAVDISPDGVVVLRGARWRARTNRATPIADGAQLRVVAIDGVTLEVEPLDGAARDYRERRGRD